MAQLCTTTSNDEFTIDGMEALKPKVGKQMKTHLTYETHLDQVKITMDIHRSRNAAIEVVDLCEFLTNLFFENPS